MALRRNTPTPSVRNVVGMKPHVGYQFIPFNGYGAVPIFTESDFPALQYDSIQSYQPVHYSRFPGTVAGTGESRLLHSSQSGRHFSY